MILPSYRGLTAPHLRVHLARLYRRLPGLLGADQELAAAVTAAMATNLELDSKELIAQVRR